MANGYFLLVSAALPGPDALVLCGWCSEKMKPRQGQGFQTDFLQFRGARLDKTHIDFMNCVRGAYPRLWQAWIRTPYTLGEVAVRFVEASASKLMDPEPSIPLESGHDFSTAGKIH